MKKIVLILAVCFMAITLQTHAQIEDNTVTPKHSVDANALLLKSKKQKTAAWLLIAGGTGLFIAGESIIFNENAEELGNAIGAGLIGAFSLGYVSPNPSPVKHSSIAPVMVYSGLGALLGSIPLFIAAHKNKVQARVFIKNQTLSLVPAGNNKQMAVGLKISF